MIEKIKGTKQKKLQSNDFMWFSNYISNLGKTARRQNGKMGIDEPGSEYTVRGGEKMIQAWMAALAALAAVLWTPLIFLCPKETDREKNFVLIVENGSEVHREEAVIRLLWDDGICQIPLEEYLVGVVLSEMPISFEKEALKAQAVAARTFVLRQQNRGKHENFDVCGSSSCCQGWSDPQMLEQRLGRNWGDYLETARDAVAETAGQVIVYGDTLIDAVYFSCSGGITEAAVSVWGTDVPYLQSVPSPGEEDALPFQSEVRVSWPEFCRTMQNLEPSIRLEGNDRWLGKSTRTGGGGIASWTIGGYDFSGVELRNAFHLRSTNFNMVLSGDEVVFDVKGYGHRVGMSQYGANAMAKSGKTYQEILSYYYNGIRICHVEQLT